MRHAAATARRVSRFGRARKSACRTQWRSPGRQVLDPGVSAAAKLTIGSDQAHMSHRLTPPGCRLRETGMRPPPAARVEVGAGQPPLLRRRGSRDRVRLLDRSLPGSGRTTAETPRPSARGARLEAPRDGGANLARLNQRPALREGLTKTYAPVGCDRIEHEVCQGLPAGGRGDARPIVARDWERRVGRERRSATSTCVHDGRRVRNPRLVQRRSVHRS
jgi:hypothetical protein